MATYEAPDSCSLYYEFDDNDHDEVVVFLNGMTQSTAHWNRQAKAFSGHYSTLKYDARGQGKSDVGDADLTLQQHAEDLTGIFDSAGIDRAHLIGFSHGARVAMAVASEYSERVDRLVLCSMAANNTALARTAVRAWKGILDSGGGLEALAWSSLTTILGNEFLEKNEGIIEGIVRATVDRNSEQGVRALVEAMLDYPDLVPVAERVSAPTLVISATEDLLVTADAARDLADITDGDWVEIENCGHTVPIEAPEEFRDAILAFLRG
jgi:pimeloyl-ACP methyl ester carboxylesterase